MNKTETDVLVIGAGVVGCAVARQYALEHPDRKVIVLERHDNVALETSGHNSGMIHSGIHENPRLLKSKLSIRGNELARQFITGHNVTSKDTGMIIAVPGNQPKLQIFRQLKVIVRLIIRGLRLKIPFRIIHPWNVRRYEPDANIAAGLYLPSACIVDPREFTEKIRAHAEELGATFRFNEAVTGIEKISSVYKITTAQATYAAKTIINSAGLYADEIADMAGFRGYTIKPWRGEYYKVVGYDKTVQRPISSVHPRHHGKGIQMLLGVDGNLYIGPNSYPTDTKSDYTSAITEPQDFIAAAKKIFPDIMAANLKWSFAGMRPKLNSSYRETDFVISRDSDDPTFINLVGIESPGLTAALAIAEYAVKLKS